MITAVSLTFGTLMSTSYSRGGPYVEFRETSTTHALWRSMGHAPTPHQPCLSHGPVPRPALPN